MPKDWTKAYVSGIPKCDFCAEPAEVDGATHNHSSWAFMCDRHFRLYGIGIGAGKGQMLIVGEEPARDRHSEASDALAAGDLAAFEDAVGDGDPLDYL